jgi:cytochrome c553
MISQSGRISRFGRFGRFGRVGRVAGRCAALLAFGLIGFGAQAQAPAAPAKPDPAKGQQIASGACAACHGADGNSVIAQNPKLNGQHAEYIVKQLVDYTKAAEAKDARVNPIMLGFATALSADDKRHVAAWFASQKPTPGAARVKETLGLGQRIYRAGIPEKAVPACAGCHTPSGAGIPVQYPRLGGQHAEYTEGQLKAFREGTRRNNASMMQIAARLSDAEMKAVSDYIAGLQ